MSECVRGCTVKRRHMGACEGDCLGCEPRQADHGDLCWPCHRRLELMLRQAPALDVWLTGNLGALGSVTAKEDFERASTSQVGSPAPLDVSIFDVRQNLRDQLASWVDNWLADSPDNLHGPDRHAPGADAEYLLRWLDKVERMPWVVDLWEELAETHSAAHALAPWRATMQRWPGLPCPECGALNLVTFGGEDDATCLSCRTMLTPDQLALWRVVCHEESVLRSTGAA